MLLGEKIEEQGEKITKVGRKKESIGPRRVKNASYWVINST